jgi:hypothetical protein
MDHRFLPARFELFGPAHPIQGDADRRLQDGFLLTYGLEMSSSERRPVCFNDSVTAAKDYW